MSKSNSRKFGPEGKPSGSGRPHPDPAHKNGSGWDEETQERVVKAMEFAYGLMRALAEATNPSMPTEQKVIRGLLYVLREILIHINGLLDAPAPILREPKKPRRRKKPNSEPGEGDG